MKTNIQAVAKEAGVSVSTVSQVMRGVGRCGEETKNKVKLAAKKLNYHADQRASSLRTGKVNEIGLVLYQLSNPFNSEIISGVTDFLDDKDYLVSILDSKGSSERQQKNLQSFVRNRKAGIIWVPNDDTPQATYNFLLDSKTPVVTFLRSIDKAYFDHVRIDNYKATFEATKHLINLGHSKIAFLGGWDTSSVHISRMEGFKKALNDIGNTNPIVWNSGNSKKNGLQSALLLFSKFPNVTALVCNGDEVALGSIIALQTLNLEAGKDVSIIGFDGIEEAEISIPPLTTLSLEPYNLGKKIAEVLFNRIQNPDSPINIDTVEAKLKIRKTTSKLKI